MNRNLLSRRIGEILNNLSRLNSHICAMDSLDIQRYPENYETISTEAALRAEKIACQLRSLLYASTNIPKKNYLVKASEAHDVEIFYEDGIMTITLPRLLPKKKQRQSSIFLFMRLWNTMQQNIPSPVIGNAWYAFPMYTIMNCLTGVC